MLYPIQGFFYGNALHGPFGDLRTKENPQAGLSRSLGILLDKYIRVLKENGDAFMSHNKEPWLPTEKREIYANRFTVSDKTIYTIYNNRYITAGGPLLRVNEHPGYHYVELLSNTAISPEQKGGESVFALDVSPKDAVAIAEFPQIMSVERKDDELQVKLSKRLKEPQLKVLYIKGTEEREEILNVKGNYATIKFDGNFETIVLKLFDGRFLVDMVVVEF